MRHLLRFELASYARRPGWYALLLGLLGLGVLTGWRARLSSFPLVMQNSPYQISFFAGLLSLFGIGICTLLAAQTLLKERDHHFALVLYATPLRKADLLGSRFLFVAGMGLLYLGLVLGGFAGGQVLHAQTAADFGPFSLWHYLQPFAILVLPNTVFCAAVLSVVAWRTGSKALVFGAGLAIYIVYMVGMLFSGSPLFAGAFPVSAAAMEVSALVDPFGISAFLQQTMQWSAPQRNTATASLVGNLLLNRAGILGCSALAVGLSIWRHRLSVAQAPRRRRTRAATSALHPPLPAHPALPHQDHGPWPALQTFWSCLSLELRILLRGISFWLMLTGVLFYLGMEFYGSLDGGIRLPGRFATTALFVNQILGDLPAMCLLVLAYYSSELVWRSRDVRFHPLLAATPWSWGRSLLAKWLALCVLCGLFLLASILLSVLFQLGSGYSARAWLPYLQLFYLVGLPMALSAALAIYVQALLPHKYVGLALATLILLVTGTGLGRMFGLQHPLWRFAAAYGGQLSDMNGWGAYWTAFGARMGFAVLLMATLVVLRVAWRKPLNLPKQRNTHLARLGLLTLVAGGTLAMGTWVYLEVDLPNPKAQAAHQAAYEHRYRVYQDQPQPDISEVRTQIDLFPDANAYTVSGTYLLRNPGTTALHEVLVHLPAEVHWKSVTLDGGRLIRYDTTFGHQTYTLQPPLPPGACTELYFAFEYAWSAFDGHQAFNAIVENGSFLRISNFFPRFGYQPALELDDPTARRTHGLGPPTGLLSLAAPRNPIPDMIDLDMRISTAAGQTAIGVGELLDQHAADGRQYFHYHTARPIPFRFAVSSAYYATQRTVQDGIPITVYYHPAHHENVSRLLQSAGRSLAYCQRNFSPYPFGSVCFAEVSAFTQGFAGTAYPGTIFMTEDMIFHADLSADAQQDVIIELAGHELSHMWWGGAQLCPDERVGAKFLTETLAMYTELMLIKAAYGSQRAREVVDMHRNIYLSERGFAPEQALVHTRPENTHQHYSKGLVCMYQLAELIGEEQVNLALRQMLRRHAFPQPAPTASDLVAALRAVSPPALHGRIDDLFCRIATYSFGISEVHLRQHGHEYGLSFELSATKSIEDGQGHAQRMALGDCLEIELRDADGHPHHFAIEMLDMVRHVELRLPVRPVRVELDPQRLWLQTGGRVEMEIRLAG